MTKTSTGSIKKADDRHKFTFPKSELFNDSFVNNTKKFSSQNKFKMESSAVRALAVPELGRSILHLLQKLWNL